MEILELLNWTPEGVHYGIIPTVLLPLAFLSTGISVVATFIAGLFGVKLKAEGPKKLLEVLLKPRVLISALIMNIALYGGMRAFQYIKHGPMPTFVQNLKNRSIEINQKAIKSDNKLLWKQDLKEGLFANGIVIEDELFVTSKEGSLFVLNIHSGELTHKVFLGKFLATGLTYFKGHLYFGEGLHHSHHMGVYKFNPKTKKIIDRFGTKGHTESKIVATTFKGEDYLLFSSGEDGLYAIDPHTMKMRWRYYNGHMDSSPLVIDNAVYIASGIPTEDIGKKRPNFNKLDLKTGKAQWSQELPLSSWFAPFPYKKDICIPLGELHVKSKLGGLQCFSPQGQRLASLFVDRPVMGGQKVVGDSILFNDFKGTLYLWNPQKLAPEWKIDNSSKKYSFSSSVKLSGLNYLFFNRSGEGIVFNVKDGAVVKKLNFNEKETIFASPIVHDHGFLVWGMKGTVKNYRLGLKESHGLGLLH